MNWHAGQSMLPIAIASSGAVSTTLTQKRRVMSRSSGFSSCTAVTVRGSRPCRRWDMIRGRGARSRDAWGRCIRCASKQWGLGLEGHAAGGTGSGLGLAHFGAHGADVRGLDFRLPASGL